MARISQDDFSGQSEASGAKTLNIDAEGRESIEVPSNDFISNAEMSRDGQDLVLEAPNGETLVVNNYFMADPAPLIESPDGSILTPNLVHSFLTSPAEFAQIGSMADESPVGAVEEISGQATIIHTDGTTEEMTLGTPVYQGDIIETSAGGAVNIVFIDETSMAVSDNARLSIDEYQFDPSTESGETNLSVLRGVFVFTSGLIGRDDPDDVMIDTPVGSIGIRGTIIAGNINPGGESQITVVEGAIVVTNGVMETTLSQQYETVRLGGFNDNMQDVGVKDALDMGKTYGSVSDVVPKLFSSINDTVKEEASQASDKQEAVSDETPVEDIEEVQEIKAEEAPEEAPQNDLLDPKLESTQESTRPHQTRENLKLNTEEERLQNDDFLRDGRTENRIDNPTFFNGGNNTETNSPVSAAGHTVTAGIALNDQKIGDFDGDGDGDNDFVHINASGDVVISDIPGTSIHTESGNFKSVSSIGDINNDGYADIIAGNPSAANGVAKVITGDSTTPVVTSTAGASSGDMYGHAVAGIGDVDGDGKSDYAVSSLGANAGGIDRGEVSLHLDGGSITISGGVDNLKLGESISGVGDVNGDGLSDVMILAGGTVGINYEAYVIFGGGTDISNVNTMSGSEGFKISVSDEIVAGGSAGDLNGDGFDDFAVSLKVGNDVDTYVIYGKATLGDIDQAYLNTPGNALKIHHAGAGQNVGTGTGGEYQITAIGDRLGDGFDDVQVGIVDGPQFIVHGALGGSSVPYVTDGSGSDSDGNVNVVGASGNDQSLLGDNNDDFIGNGYDGLRMKGGSGNNHFSIEGDGSGDASFKDIDGGKGFDTIRINTDVDFSVINFEQISQIERLQVGNDFKTITLTAENLFNLLKSSDTGELRIERQDISSPSVNARSLTIDAASPTGATIQDKIVNALNEEGSGAVNSGTTTIGSNNYDHFQIGGYDLYIDQGLTTTVV